MFGIERSAWLLTILSVVLQVVIFPLPNFYVLSWIALAPLLIALLRARHPETLQLKGEVKLLPATPMQGFLLGYVCGIIWYGGTCYWIYSTMKQYGGINALGAAGLLILFCLYLGLYHGLFGLIIAWLAGSAVSVRGALVLSPFVWVAVELARTRVTGFPWDLLGTVQVDNILLAKIATLTGVYGLSLEIMIVNVAFAAAFVIERNLAWRNRRRALLLAALSAAFLLQIARWIPAPSLPADHSALLVQENVVSHLAVSAQAWVVAGGIGVENASTSSAQTTQVFNSAALVSPSGDWIARYDKMHLVPFGEYVPFKQWLSFAGGLTKEVGDFSRGVSRAPLPAGDQKLGVFICYESIFPDEIRQSVKQGAQVLVNISNDGWYGDSGAYAQHIKQARMRAVENARWLLRDTNTGVTASIDPNGRVAQSAPRKVRTVLQASYALSNDTTFYTHHGDWLAYGCAIISIGAIIVSFTRAKATRIG